MNTDTHDDNGGLRVVRPRPDPHVPSPYLPIGSGSEFDKTYALLIEFDSRGIVKRYETKVEKFASDLTYDDLTTW